MGRRQKIYRVREDYRPLLIRVKKLFPTVLGHVKTKRILLVGFENPHSGFIAQIRRNSQPWAMVLQDFDYVIQFWSTRFDSKPKSYKLAVMLHELLHVPEGGFDRKNRHAYRKLKRHNVEDFSEMIRVYGLNLKKAKLIYKGEKAFLEPKKHKDSHQERVH
jgi:predicted metallopeptidase